MNTSDLAGGLLIVGFSALGVGIAGRERRAIATREAVRAQEAAQLAAQRAASPPSEVTLLRERIDELEAINARRFDSLKARIFWTPLLWAVIGGVLWGLALQCCRA